MSILNKEIALHKRFFETLFAYKSNVSQVFNDVLGLYNISHIAISRISNDRELLILSSTPSLEFNLFNSPLWHFDKTYQSIWYNICALSSWQSLYTPERYDELYYLKQLQHGLPLGLSFPIKSSNGHIIYSLASNKDCPNTQALFASEHENFYKIGQYCSNLLLPLFDHCDNTTPHTLHRVACN